MNNADILAEFHAAEAILSGHFILSSGLHSNTYMQCARVLMNPARAARLCHALAEKVRAEIPAIDMVVAPAMGGVIVGYEMARQLGVDSIFCERQEGTFTFRRGFSFPEGCRILVVEDVVTTGKSSLETMEVITAHGGQVVGEACLVNRNNGKNPLPVPLISLLDLEIASFAPDALPPQLAALPAVKPGSRWLKG